MIFEMTQQEKTIGEPTPEKLSAIVEQIQTIGYATIADLISNETCDLLAASVQEDVTAVRATGELTAHERNTGQGHLQLGLRRYAPYVTTDLIANPVIEAIVIGVLGPKAWLGFYNGNVNCPHSTYQPLHMDRPFSWKTPELAAKAGQTWPPPTTTLGCSIALEEILEENGATEIYPGTHLATEVIDLPKGSKLEDYPDLLEKWGPATRMVIPKGAVVIRDPRMWHRGVPNPSKKPRAMVGVTYHADLGKHWRGRLVKNLSHAEEARLRKDPTLKVLDNGDLGDGRLVFQANTREVIESSRNLHGINRNVRYVEEPQRVNHFLEAHVVGGAKVVNTENISPSETQK